jgi:hypothetical protein
MQAKTFYGMRRMYKLGLLILALPTVATLVHRAPRPLEHVTKSAPPKAVTPFTETLPIGSDLSRRAGHWNYRYLMIPLAAYSIEEFERVLAGGPVVGSKLAKAPCDNRLSEEAQALAPRVAPPVCDLDELEAPPDITWAILGVQGVPPTSAPLQNGAGSIALSRTANYAADPMPGGSSWGLIGTTAVSALAPDPPPLTGVAGPSGSIAPFRTNAPVEWQTLQVLNPGGAYSTELSYSPFGFVNWGAAGRQQLTAQGNGEPVSLSLTLQAAANRFVPLPSSQGYPGLAGLGSGAALSSGLLPSTDVQGAFIDALTVDPASSGSVDPDGSGKGTPEPATAVLLGMGFLGMSWMIRCLPV